MPLALSLTLNAFSQAFTQDGINYEVNSVSDKTLNLLWGGDCKGDVVLPESLTYNGVTYKISNIDDRAFSGCTGMTSIVIPEGVKRIGVQAFTNCSSLKSVTFPNSIIEISNMLGSAFAGCDSLNSINNYTTITYNSFHGQEWYDERFYAWYNSLPQKEIICVGNNVVGFKGMELVKKDTSIVIPYGITNIWDEAFKGFNKLISVSIPSSVTSIGKDAFGNCSNLAKIEGLDKLKKIDRINKSAFEGTTWWNDSLPKGLVIIGDAVIGYIKKYTEIKNPIVIPDGITTIEDNAFSGMNFSEVYIPSSVKRIGEHAFSYNDSLRSVSMSEGLENIGMCAFYNCKSLEDVSIPNSVVCIGHGTFQLDKSLKTVNIPDGIAYVKDDVFSGCENLTSVTIPNGVISIGEDAFENCYNLSSVDIPESVKRIGQRAFYCCYKLSSIYIPKGVEQLFYPNTSASHFSSNAFSGCTGLTSILVSADNKIYDSRENCNAIIETATGTLMQGCSNTVIPESISKIGDNAFYGCYNLQEITIPENITDIGAYAFYNCSSLSSITIPNSITCIKEGTFAYSGLTSIMIPNSVDSIGKGVFQSCNNLISLTVPESVKAIGIECFSYCGNIRTINWSTEIPLSNCFSNVDSLRSIVFGKGVKEIEDKFFGNLGIRNPHLGTVILSDGITRIGNGAFMGVPTMTSINIPSSVKEIGDDAFNYCVSLTDVSISKGVNSIGQRAFSNCSNLASITIPESVSIIGQNAFKNCKELTEVFLKGETQIGENAFIDCPKIEQVFSTNPNPGKMMLHNPLIGGEPENVRPTLNGYYQYELYDSTLMRTVTKIKASAIEIAMNNVPKGKYRVSVGILPNLEDSIHNTMHPIIKGYTDDIEDVLFDSVKTEKSPRGTRKVPYTISNKDKFRYDTISVYDPFFDEYFDEIRCIGCEYDKVLILDTLVVDKDYNGLKIMFSSISGSYLLLDRVFLEPLDGAPAATCYGPFMESVFNNATLYVPEGAVDAYRTAEGWKYFKNIAIDTSVDLIHQDDINRNGGVSNAVIYDVTGRRVKANAIDMLPPGLYIINGKKYLVK